MYVTLKNIPIYNLSPVKGLNQLIHPKYIPWLLGAGTVDVDEVVAYAHKLSGSTFAPYGFNLGMPMKGCMAPAPQEEQFRASILHEYAGDCNTLYTPLREQPLS